MAAGYPVIEVRPEWAPQTEEMGSKPKFWYIPPEPDESPWLFKHPRLDRGGTLGGKDRGGNGRAAGD